jgi:hypothetical protein
MKKKPAPAAALRKIKKLVAEGKVVVNVPEMLETPIKVGKWEFVACTIGGTFKHDRGEGFEIRWAIRGFGFGNLTFVRRPDGKVECDNEAMSREFMQACMTAFVLRCKLYDEKVQ